MGDRILFGKYTGNDITIDGQEYLILREEEILAKFSRVAKAAFRAKDRARGLSDSVLQITQEGEVQWRSKL